MKEKDLIKFCRYYKGGEESPYTDGRDVWWKIERYGVDARDKVTNGLSPKMISFIRERVWQSDSGWSTSWEEALKRANELYDLGKWSSGYISDKSSDISIAF